jgi:dTDP-4-dehydrorhamnose 3,5-epimerase
MTFEETLIPGVSIVSEQRHIDDRGYFTRIYCTEEFENRGLDLPTRQAAISHNARKGTLRGLHFIPVRYGEAKLVRCIRGSIFDVAADLRPSSPTFGRHITIELSARDGRALYLPRGIAHGFITLEDDSDVLYQFSEPHRAGIERGIRWDDPDLAIDWPFPPALLSQRDAELPLLAELAH